MTDFQSFNASTHTQVRLEDDWNNLLAHGLVKTAAYIIRKNGSYYEAISGSAGTITYGGASDAGSVDGTVSEDVIEAAITAAAGGHIHITGSDYSLLDEIDVGQSGTWITGDGLDTKITQATADKHCFKITGKTNVRISGIYMYGTASDTGSGVYALTTSTGLTVDHCFIENWGYHGILIESCSYPKILCNQLISNKRNGLNLDTVTYGTIFGNKINTNTRHGVWMDDCSYNKIFSNDIIGNDSANAATYDGININHSAATSNYNQIYANTISDNDRYEINISTASCTGNMIGVNNLYGTDRDGIIADTGTNTRLRSLIVPFVNGTAWDDSGWDIDAAGEYAGTFIHLPNDMQQLVRIKIYARGVATDGAADAGMALTITGNGAASDEAYNTEAISITNKASETKNFDADDNIYWQITSSDDADIGHLAAGDNIELKVAGQNASGDIVATDARFRTVEILYV